MRGMVHALGGLVTLGGKQELFQRATVVKVLLTRAIGSMQALRLSRSRRETMAAHDVRHLCSIRRTAGRRVDHLCSFVEKLRTYRGGRDHAERLYVLDSVVIEPVSGTSRNAQCLPWPDVNLFSVHGPGQHSVDAIAGLLKLVVAMRGCWRLAPGTTSSKAAMLPVESSPASKKRTASGPKQFAQLKELLAHVWESPLTS